MGSLILSDVLCQMLITGVLEHLHTEEGVGEGRQGLLGLLSFLKRSPCLTWALWRAYDPVWRYLRREKPVSIEAPVGSRLKQTAENNVRAVSQRGIACCFPQK